MTMEANRFFARSYAEARAKFLAAARGAGAKLQSHAHPLPGRDGERLALDFARVGDADAAKLLILSSGVHGIEGYAGSGVQNALLADAGFLEAAREAGIALLFVHAVNPWGFSFGERWTHENVDLNRNFVDFSLPLPDNPGHDQLVAALVPEAWPDAQADAVLWAYFHRHGDRAMQDAVSGGQYRHAHSLFYGGNAPTWSRLVLETVLVEYATRCRRLAWIDLHTATGPAGGSEHLLPWSDDAAMVERARGWWGAQVKSLGDDGASLSALQGTVQLAARRLCKQAEQLTCTVFEFGTVTPEETLMALRGRQWLTRHPQAEPAQAAAIEQRMRDAFYTDTDAWRAGVVRQGGAAAREAVTGLAGG
jgi:Protein of unknown function (DUF2817)